MKRREFVATVGRAGAALGLVPRTATGAAQPWPAAPTRWAWVHGNADRSAADWRGRFARLRQAGVGGVLVGGGETATLSAAARAEGLAFHRWIWVLNRSGDREVRERHPDWFTVSRNGNSSLTRPPYVGYYQWVCPTRPEVRQYLEQVVAAVARDPAVDGVHFDYIRHCDVILPIALWPKYGLVQDREYPEFDFCYCPVCRAAFRRQTGIDPLSLEDPPADEAWRRFRWDGVTGLVRRIAAAVRAEGKPVTAAVFPTPAIARRLVRQAWDEWGLDALFPMAYHGFYQEPVSWIEQAVREGVAALPPATPLYAGLYLPDLSPTDLAAAVRHALAGGAAGFSVFEMDGLSDAHREALRTVRP
jgi:uncharacterized lipoprotein YddW (UPF0748 family)